MSSDDNFLNEGQGLDNDKLEDEKIKNKNSENLNKAEDITLEDDGVENLRFNSKLLIDIDNEDKIKKESIDLGIKFSIDYAPQQRLHEYLSNDLITALDNNLSNPQTPNIPLNNNNNNNNDNGNNNFNISQIPKIDLKNDDNEESDDKINNKNINQTPLSLLKMNKFDYTKIKNTGTNVNYNNQNLKEKHKKPFEIRAGDWNCFDCSNLNFSFRIKCNRCGLPKEVSMQKFNMGFMKNLNIPTNSKIMFYPQNFNNDKNQ